MNYVWSECPACRCQITIHYVERPGALSGSLRRWSKDRTVNDGRRLEVPRAELSPDGGFRTACVCGAAIAVEASSVERPATERPAI